MRINQLTAISPIDGRYHSKTQELQPFFSELGLMRYRVFVEVEYFISLTEIPLAPLVRYDKKNNQFLRELYNDFSEESALEIKEIEATTNHDVKAVEYFIKERFNELGLERYKEFIHFGLTSQDINNTAVPVLIKDALNQSIKPLYNDLINKMQELAEEWMDIPMLARTHGQAASPTRLGKEMQVYVYRLKEQWNNLESVEISGKFGGATGNFNAHHVAYPQIEWPSFANKFLKEKLRIERQTFTTQIENYDNLAALFHSFERINTILLDMCRDIWTYISIDYFKQKLVKGEVGSSAMPHKVNPIDCENAEGNLGMANAVFEHLASKLPVSRLQRDLTDSTVLRNIGVPFSHSLIALKSILKGLNKLIVYQEAIKADLNNNWSVVAEAIQTVLRREGYDSPYEKLKELTRTGSKIDKALIHEFIDSLDVKAPLKEELKQISPFNYTGM